MVETMSLGELPRSRETWQVGRIRLPIPIQEPDRSYRPVLALCVRLPSGLVFASPPEEAVDPPGILKALSEAAAKWGVRPARVEVSEGELAEHLQERLAFAGIQVKLRQDLPELAEVAAALLEAMAGDLPGDVPGPLTGEGVTLERLSGFAAAAARFAAAEPWQHLDEEDVIEVEASRAAPEVRFASVTGRAGMQLGMLFYSEPTLFSEPDEQRLAAVAAGEGFWAVSLDAAEDISPMDLAIWERHHLPLAHENAYPVAARLRKDEVRRPDARLLAYFEGLLDAIAATTEDEMDSGRWEKKVVTADGPVRYVLSLPGVLNPPPPSEIPFVNDFLMEQIKAEITRVVQATGNATQEQVGAIIRKAREQGALTPPRNDRERAQQLIAQALPARGRRQVALARQALKLWPDCVDAHLILAHREQQPERAIPVYEKALAAGERVLGAEALGDPQHPVWTQAEAQPYLRGLIEIAQAHAENGDFESAAGHLREALRLDPDDSLDARYPLAGALSHLRRYEELAALLDRFREDDSAEWTYTRTLLIFRREGDSLGARSWLTQALRRNAYVPKYLLQEAPIPFLPPFLQPGSEAEAMSYAAAAGEIWNATPGALAWLFERAPKRPKKKTKGRRDRKRKR